MRKTLASLGFLLAAVAWPLMGSLPGPVRAANSGVRTHTVLSPIYTVDQEYRSMMGPHSTQRISFPESDARELVWLTGYRAEMVGPDGETSVPQEFMCHSNLNFDPQRHHRLFGIPIYHTRRLFTLSQGQLAIDFPDGFGLPYYSDEAFDLTTQVLSLNYDDQPREVRHKVTLEYIRDADLDEPMKPLFMTSGWGLVLLEGEDGHYNVEKSDHDAHGPGCLPGMPASNDLRKDRFGRRFSGHWVVKPGREVNRTLVTDILNIPYDTTAHYIATHLHPFAESLALVDLTMGETIFESTSTDFDDKIGIEHVDYFSSAEGIPVYKDHQYEMVSVYNNTSGRDQDAMAVMLLYLLDKKFEKPTRRPDEVKIATVGPSPKLGPERVLLRTNLGDITIGLYPDVAPAHVEQVLRLVRMKVWDGTRFFLVEPDFLVQTGYASSRLGPPLTAAQQAIIHPLQAEFSDLEHRRGTVSMVLNDNLDPNSAETSFCILLDDAPHLDGSYTIFGHVLDGFDTLERMTQVPRQGTSPMEPIVIREAQVITDAATIAVAPAS